MNPRLAMRDVSKRFGATTALNAVSLEVAPGEIHALIGENGAGKSTLMKILSGACPPDSGRMEIDGEPYRPHDPLQARRRGIAMIYQELNLAPHLNVEENILLGQEPHRLGWISRTRRRALAGQALEQLHHASIPLEEPVSRLTIAEQQLVEIARALIGEPRLLIMDEPTSSLSRVDAETLFQVIQRLSGQGVSVVYISHFLEECQRLCHRYTVLRDGQSVAGGAMAEAKLETIIHHMVGREISEIYPRVPHAPGPVALRLRQLAGKSKPRSVSLELRAGEIFGVAGLVGAGRTETVRALFGLEAVHGGEVVVGTRQETHATPTRRWARGMGFLSENRKEEGLMLNRSLADNLTMTRFQTLSSWGWIRAHRQRKAAMDCIDQLEVKTEGPSQVVGQLSGGNQQKIALGRLLHHQAEILLLDEPTRGIDVGSKAQIYRLMGQLAAQGKAILFISSYLPELLGVCDTIGVMCRGVLREVRPASQWTEHEMIGCAIGQGEEAPNSARG